VTIDVIKWLWKDSYERVDHVSKLPEYVPDQIIMNTDFPIFWILGTLHPTKDCNNPMTIQHLLTFPKFLVSYTTNFLKPIYPLATTSSNVTSFPFHNSMSCL